MDELKYFDGKMIYASEYYYNCQPDTWDMMLYPEAIKHRRDKAWELFKAMYSETMKLPLTQAPKEEFTLRMNKVRKAFEDNKRLCDEKTIII